MSQPIPVWLEPTTLKNWPTRPIKRDDLGYMLPLPTPWNRKPEVTKTALDITHIYRGTHPLELLSITFMPNANPTAKMVNWVEVGIRMTGFPILEMASLNEGKPPKLLEWTYLGMCESLNKRLAVEETHLYSGLGSITGRPPMLARIYIILARRETLAWKASLSFISACWPRTPEETVIANDHVRAGAILGHLTLGTAFK